VILLFFYHVYTHLNDFVIFKSKKSFNSGQESFRAFHILIYSKITNLTLELKILSHCHRGIFVFSYWFFLVIVGFVRGDNIIYHFIIFLGWKSCWRMKDTTHFGRCTWHLLVVKNMLSPCHFVLCHVFFLYKRRMSSKNYQFIVSDSFSFPPSFLSSTSKKLNLSLIFVGVSESILLVLIFYFSYFLFC